MARKAYVQARKKASAEDIRAGLLRYVAVIDFSDPTIETWLPHPATWLNQERWEDDPVAPRGRDPPRERKQSPVEKLYEGARRAAEAVYRRECEEEVSGDLSPDLPPPRPLLDG